MYYVFDIEMGEAVMMFETKQQANSGKFALIGKAFNFLHQDCNLHEIKHYYAVVDEKGYQLLTKKYEQRNK